MNLSVRETAKYTIPTQDILASHFTLTHVPDEIEPFAIPGVEGWRSPNPHPLLSIGRWTTADLDAAEVAMDTVLASFRDAGRGFDWMTGPQDTALLPLLEQRGFLTPALSIAAMVRDVSLEDHEDDPAGISTQMVESQIDDDVSEIMAKGFDVPSDVARIYHNAYATSSKLQRTEVYTATLQGQNDPIGVGYQSYIGDGELVLLRVAATLPEHRGRGIYRALIKRRLADAARAGRKAAVVHAYSPTSQSALADLGFVTAGELMLHRWRP